MDRDRLIQPDRGSGIQDMNGQPLGEARGPIVRVPDATGKFPRQERRGLSKTSGIIVRFKARP
jgi:hypothetical protein